jgi:hypothetical protein
MRAPIADSYFEEYQTRCARTVSKLPTLLISGTIQPRKGQLNAITAVGNLKERGIVVRLVLLGYDDLLPDYVDECKITIQRFNLENQVFIPGFSSSPKTYYDEADYLLCSSDEESMPQSILKGMASGMRVITTPVGGVKELVVDTFSGIVSDGYTADNLEEAILRALRTPDEHWQVMLKNAHLAAQMSCSSEVVTNKLLVLYNLTVEESARLARHRAQSLAGKKLSSVRRQLARVKQKIINKLRSNRLLKKFLLKIIRRFKKASLHTGLNPTFQKFLDDSSLFQDVKGFALQPSRSLHNIEHIDYKIEFKQPGLSMVSIAPVLDIPLRQGVLGIELLSPENQVVRKITISVSQLRKDEPATFTFDPIPDTQQGKWKLRVFVRNVEEPIRLFEWQRFSWRGFGRLQTLIFAAFDFK